MKLLTILTTTLIAVSSLPVHSAPQRPAQPEILNIELPRTTVAGDGLLQGCRVRLSAPAPTSLTINLTSSNPSVARPTPSTLAIKTGQTYSAPFRIATTRVRETTAVSIIAHLMASNSSIFNKAISLLVTVRLDSMTVVPSVIPGGLGAIGTLILSGTPPSGAMANIVTSNQEVLRFGVTPFASANGSGAVNLSAASPPGFQLITTTVNTNTTVVVTATYNGVSIAKTIGVIKPYGSP